MKNQKGITLIALVITIIVLLILAGVSIAMLTGENGILTQANTSKSETAKAEAIERINLALNAVKAEIYEQQVTNKTYAPVDEDNKLDTAITGSLTLDGITATAKADNTYWYTIADGVLTLHYESTINNVDEVTGSINLLASPYTITKAPITSGS